MNLSTLSGLPSALRKSTINKVLWKSIIFLTLENRVTSLKSANVKFQDEQERLQTLDVLEMSYPFSFSWPHYGFSPRPLNFQDEPLQIKSTPGPSCSSSPPHQQL